MSPAAPRACVALDSDGTVLDTMAPKQHRFLQPMFIEAFGLQPQSAAYRACADFVNLFSATRGISRFNAILLTLEAFNAHPDVRAAGFPPVPTADLRAFVESGLPLSADALAGWLRDHPSPFLETLLAWSHAVNDAILASGAVFDVFPGVPSALAALHARCRVGIVSQSPERVLRQDWGAHGLLAHVDLVAGQELGAKPAQLAALAEGRPPADVLMVGDAFGDLNAARAFGCRFFPILPGREGESWERLTREVFPDFLAGRYAPEREAELVDAFSAALPERPAWA